MSAIDCDGLTVVRGGREVLSAISFEAQGTGLVGLIGPNGAGKTTLLRALAGIQAPEDGTVAIFDTPVASYRPRALARRLAYMPQHGAVHWDIAVGDVVMLGRAPYHSPWTGPSAADRAVCEAVMEALDIAPLRDRSALRLSGGERARVLLARALAGEPEVLLADEPVAGLDPYHSLEVMEHLQMLSRRGSLVLVVLHDLALAMRFCDRLILLQEGRLAADGAPAEVLDDRRLAEVYRIEAERAEREGTTAIIPWRRLDPPSG